MRLVTKYFKYDNLIKSTLSHRTSSNELFFNFQTNSFVITLFSGLNDHQEFLLKFLHLQYQEVYL